MTTFKAKLTGAATALGFVTISTTAAFAAPANATTALNVRSGPGIGYGVVDVLFAGEPVDVTECAKNGWCYIEHSGPDGWVSSKYLVAGSYEEPVESEEPEINFGFGVDSSGNFSFGIGIGGDPVFPNPPTPDKVCFYKGTHFNGASFCVSPGATDNDLPNNWDNKISSIKIIGGASVKVCNQTNYNGACKTYGSSRKNLGFFNNKITSFKAY